MRLLPFLFALPILSFADHLPERLLAQPPSESVLCGVDIHRSKSSELLGRFGTPVRDERYPKTEEAREIIWNIGGLRIHATVNTQDIAYAVDIRGKGQSMATTGRGFRLGQSFAAFQRVYGSRCKRRGRDVTLQWSDGTELRVRLQGQRVIALALIAQVE